MKSDHKKKGFGVLKEDGSFLYDDEDREQFRNAVDEARENLRTEWEALLRTLERSGWLPAFRRVRDFILRR